jgi:ABC-type sugar transport system permease subunit
VKDKKTGKTDWDNIQELTSQGWALVSVIPINVWQGRTACLLNTFSRPVKEGD